MKRPRGAFFNEIKMSNQHPGEILKQAIEHRNISSAEAAREIGVNIASLSRLINKKQSLTAEVALKVGPFCGVEPLWLLTQQSIYDLEQILGERKE